MKFFLSVFIQHKSAGIEKRFGPQAIALGRGHFRGLPLATNRFIVDGTTRRGCACTRNSANSADKRTEPRSHEVGSRLPEGKVALTNFRQVPRLNRHFTRLQKSCTTTYYDEGGADR